MSGLRVFTRPDWAALRAGGLTTILDPLTLRAADAFLRGAPSEGRAETWGALSMNIDALRTFIDAVMLHDRLPVFDYATTWEAGVRGTTAGLSDLCNAGEEVLVDVHVGGDAYLEARTPAVRALADLPAVETGLADTIEGELSVFDHRWRPSLPELGPLGDRELTVASFRYGGLLFGGYAEAIGGDGVTSAEHLLHGKRARVLLAHALDPAAVLGLAPEPLLGRLREVEVALRGSVSSLDLVEPTFLPLLLSRAPASPRALLADALEMRRGSLVRAYRDWRAGMLGMIDEGRVPHSALRDLADITAEVRRRARAEPVVSTQAMWRIGTDLIGALAFGDLTRLLRAFSVTDGINLDAIHLRLSCVLPGRRHLRLMTRMVAAQNDYFALDRAVRRVWLRGA